MTNLSMYHRRWTRISFPGPWPVAALDWCYEKFGEGLRHNTTTGTWAYCGGRSFEFKHEEDAVLFALRWM